MKKDKFNKKSKKKSYNDNDDFLKPKKRLAKDRDYQSKRGYLDEEDDFDEGDENSGDDFYEDDLYNDDYGDDYGDNEDDQY